MNNINLQLYSFGMESNLTLQEKIKVTGELGFSGVEFAGGYDDIPVEEMKKTLKDANVKAVSAHVQLDKLEHDLPYLAELGVKYIICPMASFNSPAEAKELAADLNAFGKKCAPYGIKTGYHNHTDEFFKVDGKYLYDWLMEYCDTDNVIFEIDCGWCSASGTDPVEFINSHKGRIAAIHIKENNAVIGSKLPRSRHDKQPMFKMGPDGKPVIPPEFMKMMSERDKLNCPQGQGIVDWKAVKAAADAQFSDVQYIVEREASYNNPPDRIACLREDIKWLKENL
jgi:sugar phosphate isomerase/epimerase